jgi:hypothetical protein
VISARSNNDASHCQEWDPHFLHSSSVVSQLHIAFSFFHSILLPSIPTRIGSGVDATRLRPRLVPFLEGTGEAAEPFASPSISSSMTASEVDSYIQSTRDQLENGSSANVKSVPVDRQKARSHRDTDHVCVLNWLFLFPLPFSMSTRRRSAAAVLLSLR